MQTDYPINQRQEVNWSTYMDVGILKYMVSTIAAAVGGRGEVQCGYT